MTPIQKRFVDEYLVDEDKQGAYKRCGGTGLGKGMTNTISKWMRHPEVAEAIRVGLEAKRSGQLPQILHQYHTIPATIRYLAARLNSESVLQEAAAIAFSDIAHLVDSEAVRSIPEHARRAIKSVKITRWVEGSGETAVAKEAVEFVMWDKNTALNTLVKSLGLLKEKTPLEELLHAMHAANPELATELRRLLISGHAARGAGPPPRPGPADG